VIEGRSTTFDNISLAPASAAEVVRLYGIRMWVQQSYKQVKDALGWSDYQLRSDVAIRRHWHLVCFFVLLVGIRSLSNRGEAQEAQNGERTLRRVLGGRGKRRAPLSWPRAL
jgi:hypothetical protein